jgi:hypothetical protein
VEAQETSALRCYLDEVCSLTVDFTGVTIGKLYNVYDLLIFALMNALEAKSHGHLRAMGFLTLVDEGLV